MSCSVLLRACPRWSAPVTFGGGITMLNGCRLGCGSAWKNRPCSHIAYRRGWAVAKSKRLGREAGSKDIRNGAFTSCGVVGQAGSLPHLVLVQLVFNRIDQGQPTGF